MEKNMAIRTNYIKFIAFGCFILQLVNFSKVESKLITYYSTLEYTIGEETDIILRGFSEENRKFGFTITKAPSICTLYKPTQVYCDYKYKMNRADLQAPISAPFNVECKSVHAVLKCPTSLSYSKNREIDSFEYEIYDKKTTERSKIGKVVITQKPGKVYRHSSFDRGTESWSFSSDKQSHLSSITYDATSMGSLSKFIYSSDNFIDLESGRDRSLWYFEAPKSLYSGNIAAVYGGSLNFVLSSASGSFDKLNREPENLHVVILECDTCLRLKTHKMGIRLAFPYSKMTTKFVGDTIRVSIPIDEKSWVLDPDNVHEKWLNPTQCELLQVLLNLSSLRILGDYTPSFETVLLDDVMITTGPSYGKVWGTCSDYL